MKRLIAFVVMIICLTSVLPKAWAETAYYYDGEWHNYSGNVFRLEVNGENLYTEMPPIVFDGYSVVPARAVFEKLGALVEWDEALQIVYISTDSKTMKLKINSNVCYIGNQMESMPIVPKIINGHTMVPVRYAAEKLGYHVSFDSSRDTVIVNSNGNSEISGDYITNVTYKNTNNGMALTLKTTNQAEHNAFYLDNPLRLVIDFPGFQFASMPDTINPGMENVTAVRFGRYNGSRIVFDLNAKLTYKINKTSDTVVIVVGEFESSNEQTVNQQKVADRSITIDAGHGGTDVGAVGYDENGNVDAYEKDFNLDVALRLKKELLKHNIKVHMIRENDVYVDYQSVGNIANEAGSTLFVSIHTNSAMAKEATGIETFAYFGENAGSINGMTGKRLAEIIQNELIYVTKAVNRGVKAGNSLAVIRTTSMPAVLVEMGFISNNDDRYLLKDPNYRQLIAEAIAAGILVAYREMGI